MVATPEPRVMLTRRFEALRRILPLILRVPVGVLRGASIRRIFLEAGVASFVEFRSGIMSMGNFVLLIIVRLGGLITAVVIAVVVGHFTTAVVGGVVFGKTRSDLFEVNVFLVTASVPIHAFVFFVVASAEAALHSLVLLLRSFIFLAAL